MSIKTDSFMEAVITKAKLGLKIVLGLAECRQLMIDFIEKNPSL